MTERERLVEAEKVISEIEKRFPNWKSYRDLVECIDCTLHQMRAASEYGNWLAQGKG